MLIGMPLGPNPSEKNQGVGRGEEDLFASGASPVLLKSLVAASTRGVGRWGESLTGKSVSRTVAMCWATRTMVGGTKKRVCIQPK